MSLEINSNVSSLQAQNQAAKTQNSLKSTMSKLASGLRINSAKDDAARLAIAEELNAKIKGLQQALRNTQDGVSAVQTADAGMDQSGSLVGRLRELSVQAGNDTLSADNRRALQSEADQIVAELDRIAQTTSFNGRNMLDGSFSGSIQTGAEAGQTLKVEVGDARAAALGLGNIDLTSRESAEAAMTATDQATGLIAEIRSELGAYQNRLESTMSSTSNEVEQQAASRSRMQDADFAEETSNLTRDLILQQANVATLAQSNVSSEAALALLR